MVVVRHWSLPASLKTAGLQAAGRDIPRENGGACRLRSGVCCLQGSGPPIERRPLGDNGTALRCRPGPAEFWRLCCASWRSPCRKMVRSAGVAPASPDWHTGILLLNDDRVTQRLRPAVGQCVPPASATIKAESRLEALQHGSRDGLRYGALAARITVRPRPCVYKRTNTSAASLDAAPAGFLGGCFGVLAAHLLRSLFGYWKVKVS